MSPMYLRATDNGTNAVGGSSQLQMQLWEQLHMQSVGAVTGRVQTPATWIYLALGLQQLLDMPPKQIAGLGQLLPVCSVC